MLIKRLEAKDYEEAMDFINLVFSQAYCPFNFPKLLPLLYRPTDESMNCNFSVVENGKIRAIVGLFPAQIAAGDAVLKLGGIGGVSSHPNDRGKGWMKLLMSRCIEEMQREKFDISFLTGYRQRYMYFGYEKSGTLLEYKINKYNLRHFSSAIQTPVLEFKPLEETDVQYIKKAKELHDRQPVRCIRPLSDFYLYLLSMGTQPWAAFYPGGNMAGYLTVNSKGDRITEIFAENSAALSAMIGSWFAKRDIAEAAFVLPVWELEAARYLGSFAEDVHVLSNGNWRIFNWEKVIEALLRVKSSRCHLENGLMRLGIKEYGTINISVSNGSVTCTKTAEQPDIVLDSFTATRVLFGHVPSANITEIPDALEILAASWFPLPLSWLQQNYV